MLDYCEKYGEGAFKVSSTFGPNPKMEGDAAKFINDEICKLSPLENIHERRKWRDARLTALAKMKRILDGENVSENKIV